jgi:aspartyl-tRNA synthetase
MIQRTYTDEITPAQDGQQTAVAGHVHDIRDLGGLLFIILRDRKGCLQLVFKEDEDIDMFEAATDLHREDIIRTEGIISAAEQAPMDVELTPSSLTLVSKARQSLPIEISKDISTDLSIRLDERLFDLRRPEVRAVFSLRSKALGAMREWFDDADFEEVDTPLISAAGAEGGAELFPVVYYDEEAFLSQSPQLYKQALVASGFDRLYEFGHAFRAEEFATSRHVSEIAMFDVEIGYIEGHHDVMDLQENSLRYTLDQVTETASRALDSLGSSLKVPEDPFPRISFDEALAILDEEYDYEPASPDDLDTQSEKLLGEHFADQGHPALFVVGYPDEKFYYMQDQPDDDIASRKFDLIYRGQELSSGGQREHNFDRLVAQMKEQRSCVAHC